MMVDRYEMCPVSELSPGDCKIVDIEGLSIGIFNIDEEFYALNNVCPHQLAPLCKGEVTGTVTASEVGEYNWERDGRIIKCPWHHWKFDITTGESVFNPHETRTRTYDVEIETEGDNSNVERGEQYGAQLHGNEPSVDSYQVGVEEEIIVLYI
jgi:nitrite reductase/ring-hydroxylating ferredoxin subunit